MLNGTYMQETVENEWLFESCSRHLRIFVDFDKEFLCKKKKRKARTRKLFSVFLRKAEKTNKAIKFHHNEETAMEQVGWRKTHSDETRKDSRKAFFSSEFSTEDKLYPEVHLRISGNHPNYVHLS